MGGLVMNEGTLKKILNIVDEDDVNLLNEFISEMDSYDASRLLCYAAENNACKTVKRLLQEENVMPQLQNNYAIRIAHANGYKQIEEMLAADMRVDAKVLENKELEIKKKEKNSVKVDDEIFKDIACKLERLANDMMQEDSENILNECEENKTEEDDENVKAVLEDELMDDTAAEALSIFSNKIEQEYCDCKVEQVFEGSEFALLKSDDNSLCFVNYISGCIISPKLTFCLGVEKNIGVGIDSKGETLYVKPNGMYRFHGEDKFKHKFLKYL